MEGEIISYKTRMSIQARSEGDGMEMIWNSENSANKNDYYSMNFLTENAQNSSSFIPSLIGKRKEPKFIPYEPYKAAVSHILPKNTEKQHKDKFGTTCNHTKHVVPKLFSDSSRKTLNGVLNHPETVESSIDETMKVVPCVQIPEFETISWLAEKLIMEKKIQQLTEEKEELEKQFSIQTKVNADLKKLLVASLGEDMQAKVQYMSEDKAKLGEHVLLFSQKLSENNEVLEKLSEECDAWKRKYEACSLLVDEYVASKVVLKKKYSESTEAIRCLIKEHNETYALLEQTFWTLHHIQEAFDPSAKWNSPCNQSPWNLTQLVSATRGLSNGIEARLIGNSTCTSLEKSKKLIKQGLTCGEQKANKVFSDVEHLSELIKHEIRMKRAKQVGTDVCLFAHPSCSKETIVNCCKQCSGEIKLI